MNILHMPGEVSLCPDSCVLSVGAQRAWQRAIFAVVF
jgi:hypothetical protein